MAPRPRDRPCSARRRLGIPGQDDPARQAQDYPRRKFGAESLAKAARYFAFADMGAAYIKSTPLGKVPLTRSLYDEPFPKGLVTGAVNFLLVRWTLIALYSSVAVVAVGLRLYQPCDWPLLYGRLSDAYSVRRFWAYSWHQMMSSTAEPPVNYLLHDVWHVKCCTYLSN